MLNLKMWKISWVGQPSFGKIGFVIFSIKFLWNTYYPCFYFSAARIESCFLSRSISFICSARADRSLWKSLFFDYSNDLTRGYSKISPDDAKEVHDVVAKGGGETYFQEPDFLENPVPPLFKCGHLPLPFQTVLETIGSTVEALLLHMTAVQAGAQKKWDFVPNRGGWGKSDLRITFSQEKYVFSRPNLKKNIEKLFVCLFMKIFAFREKLGFCPSPL